MDIDRSASPNPWQCGSLEVTLTPQPLLDDSFALPVWKYVSIVAYADNQAEIYIGPINCPTDQGYPIAAGDKVEVPIDKASKIQVWSLENNSGDFVKWIGV